MSAQEPPTPDGAGTFAWYIVRRLPVGLEDKRALLDVGIVLTIGVILLIVGVIFWLLGALDRPVFGRPYYY
jgi:hypothetical protein